MQGGFVVNPRRAPRAPARCLASVASAAGVFRADTEDVGAHGCQLVGARSVRSGERVQLEISNDLVTGVLRVAGRIAWASDVEPWRLGVAFEPAELARARDWFERLVASHPGVGPFRRVPDRISLDATVYLGPPPRRLADFSPDELSLLRWVGDGRQMREILTSFGPRWATAQRSFFSLLARQHLTLMTRLAVPAARWESVLAEAERPPLPEAGVPELHAPPPATPILGTQHAAPQATPARRGGPDFVGAGVGWRTAAPRPRSADAQQCLDLARAEISVGHLNGALALLRRALALAPGDPEIAGVLGQLAFKDRATYGR